MGSNAQRTLSSAARPPPPAVPFPRVKVRSWIPTLRSLCNVIPQEKDVAHFLTPPAAVTRPTAALTVRNDRHKLLIK